MSKTTACTLCVLLSAAALMNAEQVSLKNGDRLTGTVASMDGKKLVLKTAYAGDVSIDWDAVTQFSSEQPLVITKSDKQVVTGTVRSEGDNYVVTTAQGP